MDQGITLPVRRPNLLARVAASLLGKNDEARKVSLLIWCGFLAMIALLVVVGITAWLSFERLANGFEEYDRVTENSGRVLLVDRDIVGVRRNFLAYMQGGEESYIETIAERIGTLDKNLGILQVNTSAPDRRELVEQLTSVNAAMRDQINAAAERRRVRENLFAALDPVGSAVREAIARSDDPGTLNAMENFMRARIALYRFMAAPTAANRSHIDDLLTAYEAGAVKLQMAPADRAVLETKSNEFRAGFNAFADVTQALDRMVNETVEKLGQKASEIATRLRALQTTRVNALNVEFGASIQRGVMLIAGLSALALVIAIAAAALISRLVMAPILAMARAAQVANEIGEIIGIASRGDLRNRVLMDESRTGFVRTIGGYVNAMFDSFSATVSSIRRTVVSLADATVTASGAVTEVHAGAGAQAAALQQVREALNLSAQSVTQATDNAREAGALAADANRLVAQSTTTIDGLVATIEAIAAQSRKVAQLNATIGEIAQRTNILATTTAIEAARTTGEATVFGVIAGQVNALSESCGTVAREIAGIIEQSGHSIARGIDTAAEVQRVVNNILGKVDQTDTKLKSICEAMVGQQASSTEISASVDHLFQIAEQNVQAMAEITETMERLRLLGAETSETISAFKVND